MPLGDLASYLRGLLCVNWTLICYQITSETKSESLLPLVFELLYNIFFQLLKPHFHIFLHFYAILTNAFYCPLGERLQRKLIPHLSSISCMIHKHSSSQNENSVILFSHSCCSIPVWLFFFFADLQRWYFEECFIWFFFKQWKSPRHFFQIWHPIL